MVPAFLCSLYLTFYKTDISLRRTASAGPKGVRLRESWLYFCCSLVSFFEDGRNPQEFNPRKIHLHFWHLKLLLNNKSFDVISLGASLMPLQSGVYCIWSYMHSVTSNTLALPFLDLGEISRLSEPTDMNTSIHALLQTLENHWDCISDQKTITDNQQNMLLHSVVGDLEADISTCREKQKLLGSFIYEV